MKTLAKCLGSVTLVVALAFGYLALGTRLQARVLSETIVPASAYADRFEEALAEIRAGGTEGRLYGSATDDDINAYSIIEIRLSAQSFGLLPCEWLQAGVAPLPGDIALIEYRLPDVEPLSRSEATILLLARSDEARTGHGVWLEYYAFGVQTSIDVKPAA